tara:strand:- start:48 stop:365 length:318 start_codon:yes stop_codon:yes gene_type:complete
MSDLQNKASPIAGFSSALVYEINESRKERVITNNLLVALCDSNDLIVTYKENQAQGDITARQRQEKHNKFSLRLHLVSISIASAAFYISIAGLPVFISVWVKGVL